MALQTAAFERKTFTVEAVQVTSENIAEVAKWCGGEIRHTKATKDVPSAPYIKVDVRNALRERQTRGYLGDWVLRTGTAFKVYSDKAFVSNFVKAGTKIGNDNNYGAHLSDEDVAANL